MTYEVTVEDYLSAAGNKFKQIALYLSEKVGMKLEFARCKSTHRKDIYEVYYGPVSSTHSQIVDATEGGELEHWWDGLTKKFMEADPEEVGFVKASDLAKETEVNREERERLGYLKTRERVKKEIAKASNNGENSVFFFLDSDPQAEEVASYLKKIGYKSTKEDHGPDSRIVISW